MATDYQIKFFKGAYGLSGDSGALTLSTNNQGGIYFDTTSRTICVGGLSYGGNIQDVTFSNGLLTITKASGNNVVLDFTDTASASATLQVFDHMNDLIGVTIATVGDAQTTVLDYSNTTYISTATTLVDADKKLDTAIHNISSKLDGLDVQNVQTVKVEDDAATGDKKITFMGVTQNDGAIETGTRTENVTIKKVGFTGAAGDVAVTDIGSLLVSTNVEDALQELAGQITAGDVSIEGQRGAFTIGSSMTAISSNSKKLEVKTSGYITVTDNGVVLDEAQIDTDGTSSTATDLVTVYSVSTRIEAAIDDLDVDAYNQAEIVENAIRISNIKEENGKIGSTAYTTIPVDGTITSNNPLVTKDSISSAIEDLNADAYAQASVSNDEIKVYGIKEEDGVISHDEGTDVTIKLGSNYDASNNKVALQSNITDAINALDTQADVQPVVYTAADDSNGAKLTFKGVSETNGVIAQGSGSTELQLAKVATSGAAADVAISDADNIIVGTNVEDALQEIARKVNAAAGGMRFNGAIDDTTATLNSDTNDIRPGDIYLASAAMTIGNTSVESGDMIIYTGTASNTSVTLTADNCSIVERETDAMVTSADSLTSGQIVLGSGGKEVAISTITEANLLTAMANANSALQTIGHGTDGQYVTTTVSAKENNNQNVSVALTTSTVTSTATTLTATGGVLTDSAIAPIKSYVDAQIDALDVDSATVGSNVEITYSETNGKVTITSTEHYATISSQLDITNGPGLVVGSDVTTIKNYIDSKVGGGINALDTDGTVVGTNIRFAYKEEDGIVTIGTLEEKYATVTLDTTTEPTLTVTDGTQLAVGSDIEKVRDYVDAKISTSINALNADVTSNDAAVATVEVVETNGVITNVVVTNVSAGVTVSTETPDLTASNGTGAVVGSDIASIKTYVDTVSANAAHTTNANATIPVNVGTEADPTIIGTVGNTALTAKVSFTWEQYD